jgi:AraC-like DNA-binding protein/mannose-6-phosphate isomerase-like protein (cupin superfamily)
MIRNIDTKPIYMDDITLKEGFLGQKMIVLPETVKQWLKTNHITKSFYITDLGFYPNANHHYRSRMKGSSEYIFIYCVEGEGWLKVKDEQMKVTPNHFFIIPINTQHNYEADKDNPWSIYWMHFDGTSAQNLCDRCNPNSPKIIGIPFESNRFVLFDKIFDIFKSGYIEPKMEFANIQGLNFISSFIFNNLNQTVHPTNSDNLVGSIIDFLMKNLDKSYMLEDISNEFKFSRSYIFHLFKKRTGYSLIHFFNLKKVQKGCEYLHYTDLTVKEISHRLGFQDPLYFSRLFKKHIGISPNKYKKEQNS